MLRNIFKLFGVALILLSFTFIFSNSFAQETAGEVVESEEKPLTYEERGLIIDDECNPMCGYSISISNKMYNVTVKNDSEVCNNIEKEGPIEEDTAFAHNKCMMLCGHPDYSGYKQSPNFKQCVNCAQIQQICKTFLNGSKHCWPKPSATTAEREFCEEKALKCYNKCKRKGSSKPGGTGIAPQ